jgi:hypothetical protein
MGKRLEDVDLGDFIDLVYNYSINAPSERNSARKSMLGYVFGVTISDGDESGEDMTFDGFQRSSLAMLDELDDMHSMMSGVD